MAGVITFQSSVSIGSFKRGSATPPSGRERFSASGRSSSQASVNGSKIKFPPSRGVGNFQKSLNKSPFESRSFIFQAEKETPFVLTRRTFDVSLPRGGKIDQFV